jgi:hypothetical protein
LPDAKRLAARPALNAIIHVNGNDLAAEAVIDSQPRLLTAECDVFQLMRAALSRITHLGEQLKKL